MLLEPLDVVFETERKRLFTGSNHLAAAYRLT
jgi:hypothetical protein